MTAWRHARRSTFASQSGSGDYSIDDSSNEILLTNDDGSVTDQASMSGFYVESTVEISNLNDNSDCDRSSFSDTMENNYIFALKDDAQPDHEPLQDDSGSDVHKFIRETVLKWIFNKNNGGSFKVGQRCLLQK